MRQAPGTLEALAIFSLAFLAFVLYCAAQLELWPCQSAIVSIEAGGVVSFGKRGTGIVGAGRVHRHPETLSSHPPSSASGSNRSWTRTKKTLLPRRKTIANHTQASSGPRLRASASSRKSEALERAQQQAQQVKNISSEATGWGATCRAGDGWPIPASSSPMISKRGQNNFWMSCGKSLVSGFGICELADRMISWILWMSPFQKAPICPPGRRKRATALEPFTILRAPAPNLSGHGLRHVCDTGFWVFCCQDVSALKRQVEQLAQQNEVLNTTLSTKKKYLEETFGFSK